MITVIFIEVQVHKTEYFYKDVRGMSNADAAAFNRHIEFMIRMIEKYGSSEVNKKDDKQET